MSLISPRLRAQIVKELLSVLRDPRARFILIGPPLVQLLVFSFAATLETLDLSGNFGITDAGANVLATAPGLDESGGDTPSRH